MPPLSLRSVVESMNPLAVPLLQGGLRHALLHPFYRAHPQRCPYRGVRDWLREMQWPTAFSFVNDYPSEASPGWSNNIQGVTHDYDHWYFTQADEYLWRIPVGRDLAEPIVAGELAGTPIPAPLRLLGYDHFGDLDYHEGYLYVPLEANEAEVPQPPRVCVFEARSLAFVGSAVLTGQHDAPWCAVHPETGDLYSSPFEASSLQVYRRGLVGNSQGQLTGVEVTPVGAFDLYARNGSPLHLARVQGGAFSRAGHLYLVSDVDFRGVAAIDMVCGRLVFEYPKKDLPAGAEMEGITVWDLDDNRAPSVSGQVHVVWLDDAAVIADDIFVSHFRVPADERARV